MAAVVDINFNTGVTNRFNNTVGGGPTVTNFNGLAEIEPIEVFDGDGSGRFRGNAYLELTNNASFNFGAGLQLYVRIRFMILANGIYGLIGRRNDQNNRWHVQLNTSSNQINFFANDAGTGAHNANISISPAITLGKWHTFEMAINTNVARFFIDGKFLGKSTDAGSLVIDAASSAVTRIGQINTSASGTPALVYFDGYMDSIIIDSTHSFTTDTDHTVRTWTGNTEKLHTFGSALVPHPSVIDRSFPNNIPCFEEANGQLFIVGIDEQRKIDDATAVVIGIAKPAAAPTLSGAAAAGWDYVVVFVDARGNESPPSPISSQRNTTASTVTRNNAPPSNAKYWRVYRRNVTAGQGSHYLVKDSLGTGNFGTSNDLTWVDNVADGSESLFKTAPSQSSFVAPQCNYAVFNNTRMYFLYPKLVDNTIHPTRVYYSPPNNVEIVARETSWFYVGNDDSHVITGGIVYRANVVVFKDNAMFGLIGDPETADFDIVTISESVGCLAHPTIKQFGSKIGWLGQDGVYTYDGGLEPIIISDDIQDIIMALTDAQKTRATASVDQEEGLYLISVGGMILCYHYKDSFKDNVHRWTIWRVADNVIGEGRLQTSQKDKSFFADTEKLGLFTEGLDLQSGISMEWQTPFLNTLNNVRRQHVSYSTMIVESSGYSNKAYEIGYDIGEGEMMTRFVNPQVKNIKIHVGGRCEYISYIFRGIDLRDQVRLLGINIDGREVGRR